jgi:hypothetical protein
VVAETGEEVFALTPFDRHGVASVAGTRDVDVP